jgi:hypothetical protein
MLVTLALSLGGLTLWMMVLALIGALQIESVVIGIVLVFGAAFVWILRTQAPGTGEAESYRERLGSAPEEKPCPGAAPIMIGWGLDRAERGVLALSR